MANAPYDEVIEALRGLGIRAEFHRKHQLVLPTRIWLTWRDRWYISTWVPACYPVPDEVDVVAICRECLEYEGDPFYTIPNEIAARYGLQRMTNDEFDALFPNNESPDDESCE